MQSGVNDEEEGCEGLVFSSCIVSKTVIGWHSNPVIESGSLVASFLTSRLYIVTLLI